MRLMYVLSTNFIRRHDKIDDVKLTFQPGHFITLQLTSRSTWCETSQHGRK